MPNDILEIKFESEKQVTVNRKRVKVHKVRDKMDPGFSERSNNWEARLLDFCSRMNITDLFMSHGGVHQNIDNTVYIYSRPSGIAVEEMFTVNLKVEHDIKHPQEDKKVVTVSTGLGLSAKKAITFVHKGSPLCYYLPDSNIFIFSDVYHWSGGTEILDDIQDMITSGNYAMTFDDGMIQDMKGTVSITYADKDEIKSMVSESVKDVSKQMSANLKRIQERYNKAIADIKKKHIDIPEFVRNDRYKILRAVSSEGTQYIAICTKIEFQVTEIEYNDRQYDVSTLTKKRNVWLAVYINQNNKVVCNRLYNPGFTNIFHVLHRISASFDGKSIICPGTYQGQISKVTVKSEADYLKVVDIVREIMSSIYSSGISGFCSDMAQEHSVLTDIRADKLNKLRKKTRTWKTEPAPGSPKRIGN